MMEPELTTLVELVRDEAALYAVGNLPEERMQAFARRLESGCELCQHQAGRFEETFVAAVSLFAETPSAAPAIQVAAGFAAQESTAAQESFEATDQRGVWMRTIGEREGNWRSYLLRIEPGATYPEHLHEWREQCVVLEGELERAGKRLSAGEVETFAVGTTHEPVYSERGCLLLVVQTSR
jgi:anti-sigma factor ChrR (cupin superfamily)